MKVHWLVPVLALVAAVGLGSGVFLYKRNVYTQAKTEEECNKITLEDCKDKDCCAGWNPKLGCLKGKKKGVGVCEASKLPQFLFALSSLVCVMVFVVSSVIYLVQK